MGIPAGVTKVNLIGDLPSGEVWNTGFWMTGTGVSSILEANTLAHLVAAVLNSSDPSGAMRVTMSQLMPGGVGWHSTKVYHYTGGPTAAFVGENTVDSERLGTNSGARLPNQCALVASLRTEHPGRSFRGRMYLPFVASGLDGLGQIGTTPVDAIANAWALAFTDMNASAIGKIVVVSRQLSLSTPVSQVVVDSRPDVQRRRANHQVVSYKKTATVTP